MERHDLAALVAAFKAARWGGAVKTQTYFAFSMSDDAGDSIVEYVAGVDDFETAVATYWAPCEDGLLTGVRRGWPLPQPLWTAAAGPVPIFRHNFQRTLRLTGFGLPWIPNFNLRPGEANETFAIRRRSISLRFI
jgi:hypothetical protein